MRNSGARALDETSRSLLERLSQGEAMAESLLRAVGDGELLRLRAWLEPDTPLECGMLLRRACANGQAECAALLLGGR